MLSPSQNRPPSLLDIPDKKAGKEAGKKAGKEEFVNARLVKICKVERTTKKERAFKKLHHLKEFLKVLCDMYDDNESKKKESGFSIFCGDSIEAKILWELWALRKGIMVQII